MAYYSTDILEEGLKIAVQKDWFPKFEYKILGRVDFCICRGENNLLWGEAKRGTSHDIYESFVQLIFTIKKENTYGSHLPPKYLGAFDAEKIAFVEYHKVMDIFTMNDFNWKVAPSDHSSAEFKVLQSRVQKVLEEENLLYYYDTNEAELKDFIKKLNNVEAGKFQITKNNFIHYFHEWEKEVKPTIGQNWENVRKKGYLESDFYLADLLSENNVTLKEKLTILLKSDYYIYNGEKDDTGGTLFKKIDFNDNQKAHHQFWAKYERPPKEEYWEYIVSRRDLLVPVDVRERKGSFFTPQKWVRLSQEYLERELGVDWQDNYYIWDCCAGTGNLLVGLINKYRVYASTIDKADVDVIKDTMAGRSLVEDNIFQFDFLNDSFTKLPPRLQEIINNPEERRKLVIYINPPYAEAASAKTVTGTGGNKKGVAVDHLVNKKYKELIGNATNELSALFLIRIYKEIDGAVIANFSKLKELQGQNFKKFRDVFQAKLSSLFIVPADTFDNVNGQFPIGFYIWRPTIRESFKRIKASVYDRTGRFVGEKIIAENRKRQTINQWYKNYYDDKGKELAVMNTRGNDFQNQNYIRITSTNNFNHTNIVTQNNIIPTAVYLSVRHCIKDVWLNDRDQFHAPQKSWLKDRDFQTDCLAFTLFHHQNQVTSKEGTNHFIPFKEDDVEPRTSYKSHFMIDLIAGKIHTSKEIFGNKISSEPITFSPEAQAVMDCAKELYKYYHQQKDAENDASFYDIRLYFQGVDQKGRMNPTSNNNTYNDLLKRLREAQKVLADKIARKVYEHGFLEN